MTKPTIHLAGGIALGLLAALAISAFANRATPRFNGQIVAADGKIQQEIPTVDPSRPYPFAGENLPVEKRDVRERLERELLTNAFWHSNTILLMKYANRYFPAIEKILQEEGVPEDFKYLAVIESGLRPVSSPANAKGFWQLMEGTAEQYGLEINGEVDERYHLEKSTRAACAYLKDLRERFGSWTLAATAYNMGPTSLRQNLDEQDANSFYDLNINEETSRYLFRMVAMKEIMANPAAFGYNLPKKELYPPLEYKTVTVTEKVAKWGVFAKEHGTTYRQLKRYNPWLRSASLTNSKGKTYEVWIPLEN